MIMKSIMIHYQKNGLKITIILFIVIISGTLYRATKKCYCDRPIGNNLELSWFKPLVSKVKIINFDVQSELKVTSTTLTLWLCSVININSELGGKYQQNHRGYLFLFFSFACILNWGMINWHRSYHRQPMSIRDKNEKYKTSHVTL